jgi:hypothetical protein
MVTIAAVAVCHHNEVPYSPLLPCLVMATALVLVLMCASATLLLVPQVYVHYNELLNFLRAAVSLLALPSDAGPSAVMAALAKLVEQAARWEKPTYGLITFACSLLPAQPRASLKQTLRPVVDGGERSTGTGAGVMLDIFPPVLLPVLPCRPPSKVRQAAAELQAAAGLQQQDHWDNHHHQQQQQLWEGDSFGPKAAAAAAAAAAADERLSGLLAALGAVSEQQAADRHKEMVTRLRRLDQVC